MSRRWLVPVSLSVHFAAGLGLYAAGVWRIDKVEAAHVPTQIGVLPLEAPSGGEKKLVANKPVVEKKQVAKDVTQPTIRTHEPPPVADPKQPDDSDGGGKGSGTGPGSGSGDPLSTGTCTENCGTIPTPPIPPVPPDPPPHKDEVRNVTAETLKALFQSGEREIHPPDTVVTQMQRDGKSETLGIFKLCLDAAGAPSSVAMLRSTGYDAYDSRLAAGMWQWRYRPFQVNGRGVPVCSAIHFKFRIN
jgi:hypothetical protein